MKRVWCPDLVLELKEVADEETHRTVTADTTERAWMSVGADDLLDGMDRDTGARQPYTKFTGADERKVLLRATPVVTRDDIDAAAATLQRKR